MARSTLGRKALSVLVATTMVVSLNAPISAWAGNDNATGEEAGQTSLTATQADATGNADGQEVATHDGTTAENAVTTSDELKAAIGNAQDGDTIYLAAGEYTTYGMAKCAKALTFQGAGDKENIVWTVGDLSKDVKGEANGDYSFDGSSQVAFKGMTLKFGSNGDYRGFIRIGKTVVEDCILSGKSAYWGYNEAEFKNCTFNAPEGDYALWDYSSTKMTFDSCTFNVSGKTVNAFNDPGSSTVRTVVMTDCTVNSSKSNKAVLNIKNKTTPWKVELSGDNKVTGLAEDQTTGSDLYQVECDSSKVTASEGKPVQIYKDGSLVYQVKAYGAVAAATVGETQYESVQEAVDAATEGQTVMLLADATESVTIPAGKQLAFDLNGKKLTNAAGSHTITNNGTLTIVDTSAGKTGTVDNVTHQRAAIENEQGATCTILSGNFTRSMEAGKDPNTSGGNSFYYIENYGTMTIGSADGDNNSVVVKSDGHFSSLVHNGWYNGNKNATKAPAVMTINAGTFKGGVNTIKNDDYGEVVINGGSFENATQAALFNVNVATVNGGTFESTTQEAVYTAAYDAVMDKGTTTVTGGTFKSASGKSDFSVVNAGAEPVVAVSGGTFSADLKAEWLADRCGVNRVVDDSDKTFVVKNNVDAQVYDADGESVSAKKAGYGNIFDLSKAMTSGQTLKLLCDVNDTDAITCPADTEIAVDLNGHTLRSINRSNFDAAIDLRNEGAQIMVKNGTLKSKYYEAVSVLAENCKVTLDDVNMISQDFGDDFYDCYGIATNGSASGSAWSSAGLQLTMKNCSLTTGLSDCSSIAVYFPVQDSSTQEAKLVIENSQISGFHTGVQVCSGAAEISGDKTSISAVGSPTENASTDGPRFDGAAVSVIDRQGYGALKSVSISGGKFSAAGNGVSAVHAFALNGSAVSNFDNSKNTISVTGGTFSSDPKDYVADGYASTLASDGNYVVAQKGAESKDDNNKTSGSVATDGVTVDADQQTQVAESAADAADSLKKGGSTDANKIGDFTVDATGKTDEVAKVKDAAAQPDSSVDVKLVVKADTNVVTNDKIEEIAKASDAAVVPFTLSVDMVTEVTSSDGSVSSVTVPVTETADPITVTIKVDPNSIQDKKVVVARVHNGVVTTITPLSVNEKTGEIVFRTDRFSDYAVLTTDVQATVDLSDYTNADGSRKSVDGTTFGYGSEYAFAGWYQDANFKTPYTADATSGTAYPKFVKVSDLITFKGGSLRMDLTGDEDYTKTSLRFGYEMHVPEGATLDREHWGWQWTNPAASISKFKDVDNYWMTDDSGVIANLVLTPVYKSGYAADYSTSFEVVAQVAYTTKDGTSVCAKDETRTRSVNQVAKAINANAFASESETAYANGILGIKN